MPDLTFRLVPGCSIRGQVSLSTSDPADGMRVSAYRKRLQNGLVRWEMAGSATTDSDGVFYIADLAPGSYMLFTEPSLDRPGLAARGDIAWGYPAVYYPGVTDSASAGILTVAAGQSIEADFALTRQAFFPITAQVGLSMPGAPPGFRSWILPDASRTYRHATTRENRLCKPTFPADPGSCSRRVSDACVSLAVRHSRSPTDRPTLPSRFFRYQDSR